MEPHPEPARACPFCAPEPARLVAQCPLTRTLRDRFPVSPGHTLVVPRRHVAGYFEATPAERSAIQGALLAAREDLLRELAPDGFNIGVNDGPAAGQTVMHLHVHLIPRYRGDQPDPRGGVRRVLPGRADQWSRVGG